MAMHVLLPLHLHSLFGSTQVLAASYPFEYIAGSAASYVPFVNF